MSANLPSGYLRESFRLFHLKDCRAQTFDYHYHDFDKVIFFRSGHVTYLVEGRAYTLRNGDALLVGHHQIHSPVIDTAQPYERWVLWLSPEFLSEYGLSPCFQTAKEGYGLLHPSQSLWGEWLHLMGQINAPDLSFGSALLKKTLCLQLLISLNRCALEGSDAGLEAGHSDPKIEAILRYINAHLPEDLSVKQLSERFFLSPSYLMHRFKDVTGCTLHQYILQKRLIAAAAALQKGAPAAETAERCGFRDYSAFLRSFQRAYGISPREMQRRERLPYLPVSEGEE